MEKKSIENAKRKLREFLSESRVIKSFPAKKEWIKEMRSLHNKAIEVSEALSEIGTRRAKLWATIGLDLKIHGEHIQWNDDTNEVELVESDE